jgi:hypothetical protein
VELVINVDKDVAQITSFLLGNTIMVSSVDIKTQQITHLLSNVSPPRRPSVPRRNIMISSLTVRPLFCFLVTFFPQYRSSYQYPGRICHLCGGLFSPSVRRHCLWSYRR